MYIIFRVDNSLVIILVVYYRARICFQYPAWLGEISVYVHLGPKNHLKIHCMITRKGLNLKTCCFRVMT